MKETTEIRTHSLSAVFVRQVPPHGRAKAHPDKHHLREEKKILWWSLKKKKVYKNKRALERENTFLRGTYRRDEGHLVAGQLPLTVQLWGQDTEDHHLHGVSHLIAQRQSAVLKRIRRRHCGQFCPSSEALTQAIPVMKEIFHWNFPKPIRSRASSTVKFSEMGPEVQRIGHKISQNLITS